jgi:hypothetical protein
MLVNKENCHHQGEVYYDLPMDNYYCSDCSKGMGVAYYRLAQKYEALQRQLALKGLVVGKYLVKRFRDIDKLKPYVGALATEEKALEIIQAVLETIPEGYEFFQLMNFTMSDTFVVYKAIN